MQLDIQQLFSTKRQQVHALQEGQPFSEVIPQLIASVLCNIAPVTLYMRILIKCWWQLFPS